jgi:hypothetical protein
MRMIGCLSLRSGNAARHLEVSWSNNRIEVRLGDLGAKVIGRHEQLAGAEIDFMFSHCDGDDVLRCRVGTSGGEQNEGGEQDVRKVPHAAISGLGWVKPWRILLQRG